MDQVKAFFRAAGKQIFWVGCGVILAVSMASWYFARSNLQGEFDTNLLKIDGKMKTVATLMQTQDAPNEHSHAEMERVNNTALKLVLEAWQLQYSHQEGILQWPKELRNDFIAAVRPLKPIESKVDFPTPISQELKVDFRMRYANYVERLLPRLAEVVGTRWMVGSRAARSSAMPTQTQSGQLGPLPSGQMPIVEWDQTDQSRLLAGHFDWSSQPDSAPTTLQVLYAQEDLWILTALVGIIARTNEGAESRHDAVVKTIRSMRIGRGVTGRSGQITRLGGSSGGGFGGGSGMYEGMGMGEEGSGGTDSSYMSSSGGGESASAEYEMGGGAMGGMEMGGGAMGGMEMGGGEMGEGEMGGTASGDPGQARYVDNEYNPLPAARVREALQSGAPEDAFLVVAKRMPIRLQLIVDQRKLPRLMVEFGNSPLPVEVRQVRVNRSSGSSGGGDYGGGMGGGMSEMGGSMGGMGGGMGDMGGGMGGGMGEMGGSMGGMGGGGYSPDYGGAEGSAAESEMGYGGMGGGDYGTGFGGGYGGAGNMQNRTSVSSTTAHDVPVEVYGIIYIYNPVDKAKLGLQDTTSVTSVAQPSENTAG